MNGELPRVRWRLWLWWVVASTVGWAVGGAVTGAIMVLGLLKGEDVNNNDELKASSYGAVKDLIRDFVAEYKTTKCRDLIGCDLNTPEGSAKFEEEKIMENICADCVEKAVQIVEDLTA